MVSVVRPPLLLLLLPPPPPLLSSPPQAATPRARAVRAQPAAATERTRKGSLLRNAIPKAADCMGAGRRDATWNWYGALTLNEGSTAKRRRRAPDQDRRLPGR